jgi:magnesium chelatase subunit D
VVTGAAAAVAEEARWADAVLAAALVAVDPAGLGGACLRGGHSPPRDAWIALLRALLPAAEPLRKLPHHIGEDRLLGGLDLAATLSAGRPIAQRGVLAEADGGLVLLSMAERLPTSTVAQLAAVLDLGEAVVERQGIAQRIPARIGAIALDEGRDDEGASAVLRDRLAFWIDLSRQHRVPAEASAIDAATVLRARALLPRVEIDAELTGALCATALRFGILSLRAGLFALRAARVAAALDGRTAVDEDDAALAARLVFSPRAQVLPEPPAEAESSEPPDPADAADPPPPGEDQARQPDELPPEDQAEGQRSDLPPEELLVAAALAAIPQGLLDRLKLARDTGGRSRSDGRAGALRKSMLRGRPLGARRGDPRAGARLALIDTLRAAAPWQPLRRAAQGGDMRRVRVRPDDFHVMRYRQRTQSTTIFVVDASGSSALNRLAEAKGAVELLLADCYVRRDQVAVIAFRGPGAEVLLPPTRSLVRAKRGLAGLPGGAGTPLASALDAALALAEQVRRAGHTPTVVLLTDGQANIARDGTPGRERAEADALAAARRVRSAAFTTLFVDISPRSNPKAARLAAEMGARYLPLPHADARRLSGAVRAATAAPAR